VSDGDTISVLRDGAPVRVRLAGIDAPEKAQAFGAKAKARLSDLAFGRTVTILVRDKDLYGRTVGTVLVFGRDLNQALLQEGFAWFFERYQRSLGPDLANQYREAADEARRARRGLWADPRPVPPWDWRRRERAIEGEGLSHSGMH